MAPEIEKITKLVEEASAPLVKAREEMQKVIVGQTEVIDQLLLALIGGGHVIIEGLPGLAKTLIVNTLSSVIQCEFKRIQFTPDLLPADLLGTSIYLPEKQRFEVSKGPLFTQILLADEINRAPAKVQSALLEVMQERQITISGKTYPLKRPFMVLATQNPIEQSGTYRLPEAQTDRFMLKVFIGYPSQEEESKILSRMNNLEIVPKAKGILTADEIIKAGEVLNQIYMDDAVTDYLLNLVFASREPERYGIPLRRLLLFGISPRGSIALKVAAKGHAFLQGRGYVTPHDIKAVGHATLRHRLRRTYEAEAEGVSPDDIIDQIFDHIPVP